MSATKVKELLALAEANYNSAKEILSNPESSAEDVEKVESLIKDADGYKAKAAELDNIMEKAGALEALRAKAETEQEEDKDVEPRKSGKKFDSVNEFIRKAWEGYDPQAKLDPRLQKFSEQNDMAVKTMSGQTGAAGGFLIPPEFMADLYGAMAENSIVRQRGTIIRMNSRQLQIPVLDQTGTTAGTPHWFGGMSFYWTEEGAEKTASDPEFRQITLQAHKLIGYTRASDELVADSAISIGDFLTGPMGFQGGIAWNEDYTFLRGNGAGQPQGVINAGATITVARTATSPAIQYDDLVNMLEASKPGGRYVWVVTQNAMSTLLTMNGPTGNPSYLWGNAVAGVPNTLLGYPVIFSEKLPTEGNAGDVLLADFSYYLIGDRQATTIESTKFDKWSYDQTSWRVVHRVDGQPWLSAPLTYVDGTVQVSPFVILGAKSTS